MTATDKLRAIIRRDIESGHKNYAAEYGYDWFNLSPEEETVFGLTLDDMPSLVAVWCAYEAVLDICDALDVPDDIAAVFRAEHPWLAADYGEGEKLSTIGEIAFARFAKLFGVPARKSHAWYAKHDFWNVRAGITYFTDKRKASPSLSSNSDDDIPF